MIIQLPSPEANDLISINMSAETAGLSSSAPPQPHLHVQDLKADTVDSAKDIMASKKLLPTDILVRPWRSPPTRLRFHGPNQDDSTYAVICGLRTLPARFLVWFNLPLCWFVGLIIATRHINTWLNAHFSGPHQSTIAIALVMGYIVYTILAHTVAVYAAIVYELWQNPYARAPTLRGEVGREEEVAMATRNRVIARRMGRTFLPCLDWRA